jgi:hypothetical protein
MYIGPSATSKGFKFYDPESRKIFESRDVIWYDAVPFFAREPNPKPESTNAQFQDPFEVEGEEEDDSDDYTLPVSFTSPEVIPPPARPIEHADAHGIAPEHEPAPEVPQNNQDAPSNQNQDQGTRVSRRLQNLAPEVVPPSNLAFAATEVPLDITTPKSWQQAM